ncbi:MAG: LLM class flavin-dependent oxidoreductase [Roseomonas sp.]|nr:LLM class flavin-dependent oxidoreductase [Roseomonas sp.]MCA3326480.1 LLM class flavin-dependent oxidoreductase [Roseomonas sp.]MCA3331889.1 LLM class flavin-dependent oxidoreductase [Roseomonas sp.]MCA3336585.1 LLM class flavin-dependent oxidoreductase [Roseomonas sp.]MCA3345240.1 LLM class flavin-dependent oxidoreductase [Roseomonas sp.]
MPREIRFNAFDMACVGHIQQGMWRHPRDRSADYLSLHYWMGLARLLEEGLFDGLFLADVLGIYDVHGGNGDAAIRSAVQVPLLDPMLLVPAMAAATRNLGFGVTCNLAWESPALLARRFSTLDHLTQGRIGWNIVTGYLDSAARAMGLDRQMAHDDRYDLADEYMEIVYRLWEESWAADAVKCDRAAGIYADPARVKRIRHEGRQYRLDAPHLVEPSPQRTPTLYQAGASDRGRGFAARHAECVFVNGGPKPHVAKLVADLRARAAPRPIRIFVGATLIIGRTRAEAEAKLAEYRQHVSIEGALAHASASLGIDLARFALDEELPDAGQSQAIRSNVEALRAAAPRATKRALMDRMVLGSRQPPIVGSVEEVAEELIAWVDQADVDGFNLSRTVTPECLEDVVRLLVPALQERGRYKRGYAPGSYREKLFGAGPLLAAPHPAAGWRQTG